MVTCVQEREIAPPAPLKLTGTPKRLALWPGVPRVVMLSGLQFTGTSAPKTEDWADRSGNCQVVASLGAALTPRLRVMAWL